MKTHHMELVSIQPYWQLAEEHSFVFPNNADNMIFEIKSSRLSQPALVNWIPDCFTTILLCDNPAQPPLLIAPSVERKAISFCPGNYYSVKLQPLITYSLYHVFHSIPDFTGEVFPALDMIPELDSAYALILANGSETMVCMALLELLRKKLRFAPQDETCALLLKQILQTNGHKKLTELSDELFISMRHAHNILSRNIGCGYKMLVRILRIHNIILTLYQSPGERLLTVPYEYYYDQSHYIREFKSVCGVLPSSLQTAFREKSQS